MRSGNAGADGRTDHGTDSAPDRGSQDSSATCAYAHFGKASLSVLVGGNVAFSLGLGVGALGIDDFSVQMVAGAVGQDEFIGTEVDDGPAVDATAGSGVHDPATQLGAHRNNDFAVAQDVLAECRVTSGKD